MLWLSLSHESLWRWTGPLDSFIGLSILSDGIQLRAGFELYLDLASSLIALFGNILDKIDDCEVKLNLALEWSKLLQLVTILLLSFGLLRSLIYKGTPSSIVDSDLSLCWSNTVSILRFGLLLCADYHIESISFSFSSTSLFDSANNFTA